MLDFITRLIYPIVQIKRDEWQKSILMFIYFAFTIATIYILKPVRNSIFLSAHGAENLRYAYLGEGPFLLFATFFYVWLTKWLKRNVLLITTTAFFLVNILFFWYFFHTGHARWLAYLFYVWHGTYSITVVTQFWTLANDIFDPQEAKRLFGLILSGGGVGSIVGSLVANQAAERIGTENLLLIPVMFLLINIVVINIIWKREQPTQAADRKDKHFNIQSDKLRDRSAWKLLFTSRYLQMIAAIVVLAKIASTLVDNQWNSIVEQSVVGEDARTAFYSGFFFWMSTVAFVMQLLIASRVLRYFGVGVSLLLLPIGLCFGSATAAFLPLLGIACATKMYDGSFNYSVQKMGQEILYLPIRSRDRYKVKPIIDMLFYRSSKSLGGLLIILIIPLLGIPVEKLGIVVLLIIPFWVLAVWGARDEYMQAIKNLLVNKRSHSKTAMIDTRQAAGAFFQLKGEHSFEKLKTLLGHRSSVTRKMSATACLAFYSCVRNVNRVKKLVEEMLRYETLELKGVNADLLFEKGAPKENKVLDEYLFQLLKLKQKPGSASMKNFFREEEAEVLLKLSDCLNDPNQNVSDKKKAILILSTLGTQGAVDILLTGLAAAQDHSIRFNLIRALNRIRSKKEPREFNVWIIKKEILGEIRNNEALSMVLKEYRERMSLRQPEEDYLLATLEALREESLERIFRLLALLYSSDVIHVIYDRLVELDPDRHIRANALELLENIVEPELARKLRPIFDDTVVMKTQHENLEGVVQDFLKSQDRWLQVCAVFLVAELELSQFYPVLQQEISSRVPIVREAAEIAMIKVGQGQSS